MALGPAAQVAGCGPAGLAAAALLARDGWSVTLAGDPSPSPAGRLVTLNRGVADLITDLFGAATLSRAGGWTARRRLLDWDPAIGEVRIDEPTVMVEVHRLAEAMRSALAPALTDAAGDRGAPATPAIEAFGRAGMAPLLRSAPRTTVVWRDASGAVAAALRAARTDTLVRATRDGWVFAADVPDGAAFAQVSVPSCPAPMERAAAVLSDALGDPPAAADLPPPLPPIDTTPCLGCSLSPAGALKAGDAVLSMDPLSGDGIGSAMRSGILAAGVLVRRARTPAETPMLHAHYDRRLLTAFGAHLDRCAEFYAASRLADTWRDAIKEMEREGARIRELGARSGPDLYRNDAGVLHPRHRGGRQ
ncbi:MAG TPA: hypothetical protein VK943_02760 [Arenibaculum sp.]|nr:hypothetical protein [Arenibaculum sp.]